MDKGYISLWRSIQDNEIWFEEPFTRAQAWIDMLLLANHKKTSMRVRGIKIEIERGQIGRAKETLAERWQWSRSKVMRFLDELENDGMIEQQTSIKNSRLPRIISIVNYEKFQQNEQQKDNKKTLNEQQKDTNNNVNNENKEEHDQSKIDQFEVYWKKYPRKEGKSKALKSFLKIKDFEKFDTAFNYYTDKVSDNDLRYIKQGSAFFHQWEDIYTESQEMNLRPIKQEPKQPDWKRCQFCQANDGKIKVNDKYVKCPHADSKGELRDKLGL